MKQNNCIIIGLTGGIATGKSTVSRIIKKYGYKVIDADKIAKEVVEKDTPAYKEIVEFFGEGILNEDRSINRKKLGSIIFKKELLREKLNDIVHPYVFQSIKKLIDEYSQSERYIFVDVPLLIEEMDNFTKYGINFHEIWLVYTDDKTQLDRLIVRDSIDKKEGKQRIKAQMPIMLKREYATKVIDNGGNLETLEKQMEKIMDEIM
jgi:dephospho-CoA kinase